MPRLQGPKTLSVYKDATPREKEYTISDGRGLSMLVTPDGSKLWIVRYSFGGRSRKLAIKGGFPTVSLDAARKEAARYRAMIDRGEDPAEVREQVRKGIRKEESPTVSKKAKPGTTFREVSEAWLGANEPGWSKGHVDTMRRLLVRSAYPWIGDKGVWEIKALEYFGMIEEVGKRRTHQAALDVANLCGRIFRHAWGEE